MCSVRSFFSIFFQQISTSTSGLHICSSITSALSFFFSFFHFSSLCKTFIYCCFEEKSLLQFPCETKPEEVLQKGWRRTLSLHG